MFRLLSISLMFSIVLSSTAVAKRPSLRQRSHRRTCCPQECCRSFTPKACLQQKWIDYPGAIDMYIALYYWSDCGETGEEDLWYGAFSQGYPQTCPNCEDAGGRWATFPGHGMKLDKDSAWTVVKALIETAGIPIAGVTPSFHRIPSGTITSVHENIDFIAVPIKVSSLPTRNLFFCLQTEALPDDVVTPFSMPPNVKDQPGAKYRVEYKIGSESRTGLLWLK